MTLTNKKLTLKQLIDYEGLYHKFYRGVQEWSKVLQLAEQVLTPIKVITKAYNDKLEQLQEELRKDPSKQLELDRVLNEMLKSDVEIKLAIITEEEAKRSGLNASELTEMLPYIKRDKPDKTKVE
jgi:hypothetical protein